MVAGWWWWLFRMESRESFWRVNELAVDIKGVIMERKKRRTWIILFLEIELRGMS